MRSVLASPPPFSGLLLLAQDTATSTAQAMVDLHHDLMFMVISISFLVLYLLFQVLHALTVSICNLRW